MLSVQNHTGISRSHCWSEFIVCWANNFPLIHHFYAHALKCTHMFWVIYLLVMEIHSLFTRSENAYTRMLRKSFSLMVAVLSDISSRNGNTFLVYTIWKCVHQNVKKIIFLNGYSVVIGWLSRLSYFESMFPCFPWCWLHWVYLVAERTFCLFWFKMFCHVNELFQIFDTSYKTILQTCTTVILLV